MCLLLNMIDGAGVDHCGNVVATIFAFFGAFHAEDWIWPCNVPVGTPRESSCLIFPETIVFISAERNFFPCPPFLSSELTL